VGHRFTLADVVKRTGARRRSIQLWADGGVILSSAATDRAGTGVHRSFAGEEVQLAALLAPLAGAGMPIGVLRHFAAIFRHALWLARGAPGWIAQGAPGVADQIHESLRDVGDGLKRAIEGVGQNYLVCAYSPIGDARADIAVNMSTDERGPVCINPGVDFNVPAGMNVFIILDTTKILRSLLS
jgi:hypothetical protein